MIHETRRPPAPAVTGRRRRPAPGPRTSDYGDRVILANTSGGGSRLSALATGPKKGPARDGLPGATRKPLLASRRAAHAETGCPASTAG